MVHQIWYTKNERVQPCVVQDIISRSIPYVIHHLDKSHFQALAAILEILGVWVVGGGVLL